MVGVAGVGLGMGLARRFLSATGDTQGARQAVQFEVESHLAVFLDVGLAGQTDDQGLAPVDIDRHLVLFAHAIKEGRRRQRRNVAVLAVVLGVFGEYLGVHQIGCEIVVVDMATNGLLRPGSFRLQIGLRKMGRSAANNRFLTLQYPGLQGRWEPVRRIAEFALHHRHHRFREGNLALRVLHIVGPEIVGDHEQRQITNHLGRRGDLDDVAEQGVGIGVGLGDLVPAMIQAHRAGLFAQIGVLAAGHFVAIDIGSTGADVGLERCVEMADALPVAGKRGDAGARQPGIPFAVFERGDDGAQAGLRGQPAHRIHGAVHRVDAGFDGG